MRGWLQTLLHVLILMDPGKKGSFLLDGSELSDRSSYDFKYSKIRETHFMDPGNVD